MELSLSAAQLQQRKLLMAALFLLIWGEAANIRFMPECLCYFMHQVGGKGESRLSDRLAIWCSPQCLHWKTATT